MEYAPRGFDRLVQVFSLICCSLPCAYGEGGFCWKYGSQGQTCTAACTSAALVCVNKFDKVGSEAAFQELGVACSGYGSSSYSGYPAKDSGNGYCNYQTGSGGDCTTSIPSTYMSRLCSCQCAAGTYSTSDLKSWPCEE